MENMLGKTLQIWGIYWETHWELEGDIMQTHWKAMKNGKRSES